MATSKGIPLPVGTDPVAIPEDLANVAEWVDDHPGVSSLTYTEINALTGADLWPGRVVWQSNGGTNRLYPGLYEYNGVNWRKPWNVAWGLVAAPAVTSGAQPGISAVTDIADLTITFAAVTNRLYRTSGRVSVVKSPTLGDVVCSVTSAGGTQLDEQVKTLQSSAKDVFTIGFVESGLTGSITRKVRLNPLADTVATRDDTGHNFLRIEDVGPNGTPA